MDLRSFLFKKRSYTPIPIVLAILYFSQLSYPFWVYGTAFIVFGELIRLSAVPSTIGFSVPIIELEKFLSSSSRASCFLMSGFI